MSTLMKKALLCSAVLIVIGLILGGIALLCGAAEEDIPVEALPLNKAFYNTEGFHDIDSSFESDNCYEADAAGITELRIDWIAGDVEIVPYDGNVFRFSEAIIPYEDVIFSSNHKEITEEIALRYALKEDTLFIQFCKDGKYTNLPDKKLLVEVPAEQYLELMEVSTTSADVRISDLNGDELKLDSTSGDLAASGTFTEVEANSNSGNIRLEGSLQEIDATTVSGDVLIQTAENGSAAVDTTSGDIRIIGEYFIIGASSTSGNVIAVANVSDLSAGSTSGDVMLETDRCPDSVIINTTSGDVELSLPADSDFSLVFDTASGDLNSSLPISIQSDSLTYGDGKGDFFIDTTSGDLTIR